MSGRHEKLSEHGEGSSHGGGGWKQNRERTQKNDGVKNAGPGTCLSRVEIERLDTVQQQKRKHGPNPNEDLELSVESQKPRRPPGAVFLFQPCPFLVRPASGQKRAEG